MSQLIINPLRKIIDYIDDNLKNYSINPIKFLDAPGHLMAHGGRFQQYHIQADKAYINAAIKYFGEFARVR